MTCEDLIEQGYRWMPGVDVVLLGKISGDTLYYYQLSYEAEDDDSNLLVDEDYIIEFPEEKDNTSDSTDEPKDDVKTDSIFKDIYFNPIDAKTKICDCASPIWRYFKILIKPEDIVNIEKYIDQKSISIQKVKNDFDYFISKSKVINFITRDTFDCETFAEDEKYFLSSSVS